MAAPTAAVHAINQALDILENALEPLLVKNLHETIENQNTLEQAKLCAMLPYVVDQLITIYLGTRGIDPNTHYVHTELERIKVYFHKIARAEGPNKTSIERISDQTMQLDKDAANRFIKAALAEATRNEDRELKILGIDGPTNSSHMNWQPRQRGVDEQPAQPEGGMDTRFVRFNDNERNHSGSSSSISGDELPIPVKSVPTEDEKKRKRPVLDPFTGYSEPRSKKAKGGRVTHSGVANVEAAITPHQLPQVESTIKSDSPVPTQAQSSTASKNARKKAKKKARLEAGSRDKTPATPIAVDMDGELGFH